MKLSHLLAALCFCFLSWNICAAQYFTLPGSFSYALNSVNQVMDVSPDGKIAVALRADGHTAILTAFDPISGQSFDSKAFGFGPEEVQLVKIGSGLRAAVLTNEGGPRAVYLFDISVTGQLTQLSKTSLTTSIGDVNSNLVLSSDAQVGFVIVDAADPSVVSDLVTFSLIDGSILNRYPVNVTIEQRLGMYEAAGKRTLALFQYQIQQGKYEPSLWLIDASNPALPVSTGTVPLSPNPQGDTASLPGVAFSSDGRYLFAGIRYGIFSVVDLSTRQVVATLPGYRVSRVKIFEDSQKRLLALQADKPGEPGQAVLVDATDPLNLSVLNQYSFASDYKSDLTFSKDGSHLILAELKEMTALKVPSLAVAWKQPVPGSVLRQQQIISFGEDVLGAWDVSTGLGFTSAFGSFPVVPPDVSISSDVTVTESDTAKAEFNVTLSAPTSHRVTVTYNTADGTATRNFDYANTSGTLTFEPGETTKAISIPVLNDSLDEFDETFTARLSNASVGILQRSQATCTITDDDPQPSISINDASVTERDTGPFPVIFTISLSAPSGKPVTIRYDTADITAVSNITAIGGSPDYTAISGSLTFAPGQTTNTLVVSVNGDGGKEPDETFAINLTNPQNASLSRAQGIGTIIDDDTPVLRLSAANYTIKEGQLNTSYGVPVVAVDVVRVGDEHQPATVQYFTSDQSGVNECNQVTGFASERCDYATQAGTLRFSVGQTVKTILIPIINDGYKEGAETFSIKLQNSTGDALGTITQATIIIEDDLADATPTTGANNPYLNNEFFVRQNYLDFLSREPDYEGWTTWLPLLNSCGQQKGFLGAPPNCDRAHVSHGIIASPEFIERGYLIYRMYEVGLLRLPRYNEFVPDMASMSAGPTYGSVDSAQNIAQFIDNFSKRQEFINKYGDVSPPSQASQFISRLEQSAGVVLPASTTTLSGQPIQYGRQELINKRASGEFSVGQTFRAFVEQKVVYDKFFERGFVTMQYFGHLRRDPDLNDPSLSGWTEWVFVFTNGGAQRGRPDILPRDIHHLIFGFIYSTEYRKRFGQP